MIEGRGLGFLSDVSAVGAGAQDVVEAAAGSGAEFQRVAAGGIEARLLVAVCQPENAEAGAEAELRIAVTLHDRGDERVDMGPQIPGLVFEPCPGGLYAGALMRLRLMLLERGGASLGLAADVGGDLPATMEDFDHRSAQAHIDLLADVLVGHRVEMPVDGDVGEAIQLHIFTALSSAHFV